MGNRLSKIITRTGDDGTTGLGDGSRVLKTDARIEAIGDVDELNSSIGIVLATGVPDSIHKLLVQIQHDLFDLGGELCIPGHTVIGEQHCLRIENAVQDLNSELSALKEFILPGGHPSAAHCHLARAICRRAERHVLRLESSVNLYTTKYLNRLSDFLFVTARFLNKAQNLQDVMWLSPKLRDEKQS